MEIKILLSKKDYTNRLINVMEVLTGLIPF